MRATRIKEGWWAMSANLLFAATARYANLLVAIALVWCGVLAVSPAMAQQAAENPYKVERTWPPYFLEHEKLFTEKAGVYKAGPHPVWTLHALGGYYGNTTVIEGNDGLIIYDTGVCLEHGKLIASEIRKISSKPIKVIFYSHHHGDHYNGTAALVSTEDVKAGKVKIYAWDNFEKEKALEFDVIANRQVMGVLYYSGLALPPDDKHFHGCCGLKAFGSSGYLPPTDTFSKDTDLTISGVRIRVFYTGGEAISEFVLSLPDFDMVVAADEFFYSLANLHSIRGSRPRLPENYMKALDRVRSLNPEWLLGGHIMPIQGREKIQRYVTVSRDAIQYLWDQSIRYINKGYTPRELQQKIPHLPEYLTVPPYTAEMYGTAYTAVPEFYTGWVSWFDGDAANLFPTEPRKQAGRYVELMGGRQKVLDAARKSFSEGDPQMAAELTTFLIRIDHEDKEARSLKAACLRKIGYGTLNTITRSWYLTGALELEGKLDPRMVLAQILTLAVEKGRKGADILEGWRYLLKAEAAGTDRILIGFEVTDTGERLGIELRNSILEVHKDGLPSGRDATVRVSSETLGAVDLGKTTLAAAIDGGKVDVRGDVSKVRQLESYLDREVPAIYMHVR